MKRLPIVAALLLGAAAVAGVARPDGSHAAATDTPQRTIIVTGTGTATSSPTRASVSFGVSTQAATATVALAQNASAMRKVIATLEGAGAKDIRTESVSLSAVTGDQQQVQGYQASNSVSATVTYTDAGATIDAAVDAGANQVYGPSPLADDADAVYRQALAAAVANARAHGETLARAAGQTLGSVVSITEGSAAPIPLVGKVAAGAADSTPVVPGTQETTATVTVTFELS